jgi:hypothetical protein
MRAIGQIMRFWQCHDRRFSKNDFRIYPVFLNRRTHEADINLPEPQPLQLFVCRQFLQFQLNGGTPSAKRLQNVWNHVVCPGTHKADRQLAEFAPTGLSAELNCSIDLLQNFPGLLKKNLSRCR